MGRRQPDGPAPAPVTQRVRMRVAKRGRLRFASHRDFARAFERALRRAAVPMAYSAGFSPHPRISYVGAAPTGTASEAEYLEIGLVRSCDPRSLLTDLNAALPDGFTILEAVPAGPGSLAERMEASSWRVELPGAAPEPASAAVEAFLAADEVLVERLTRDGRRRLDARAAVVSLRVGAADGVIGAKPSRHAILDLVVRQTIPAVRPDDVLAALNAVAGFAPDAPPRAVRLAQGPLIGADGLGAVGDPLAADRVARDTAS
jgi:radical SAM-linked protein